MDYSDDVPTEQQMKWHGAEPNLTGGAHGTDGGTKGLPIGMHYTPEQRQEHRLTRAGIIVVHRGKT